MEYMFDHDLYKNTSIEDFKNFVDNYNFYNYYYNIILNLNLLKQTIIETFGRTSFKSVRTTFSFNPRVTSSIDITKLNELLVSFGIDGFSGNFIDLSDFFPTSPTRPVTTQKTANFNATTNQLYPIIIRCIENKIDDIYTSLFNDEDLKNLRKLNMDDSSDGLTRPQKDQLKTGIMVKNMVTEENVKMTPDNILITIERWNKDYLNRLHCSLRYQGNFINTTLNEMKAYLTSIQKHEKDVTNFPGKQLNNQTKYDIKFVLFTNIRLDFNPDETPTIGTTNNNFREAYIRSINFTKKINPFAHENKRHSSPLTEPTKFPRSVSRPVSPSSFGKKRKNVTKKQKTIKNVKQHISFLKKLKC
jgi:hypothetical protein